MRRRWGESGIHPISDTQTFILSAAAERPDGNLLPLPGSLRGGAAIKVVGALLARGLAQEQATDTRAARPARRSTHPAGAPTAPATHPSAELRHARRVKRSDPLPGASSLFGWLAGGKLRGAMVVA